MQTMTIQLTKARGHNYMTVGYDDQPIGYWGKK